ncbi:MAG: hypothetical protein KKD28_07335 [Chloroflexi bacterium]|nr:hypothetical protein [Chloroflexota bacterium]MBU1661269.1 hypothetical protein [Chloroflexota bacterium]
MLTARLSQLYTHMTSQEQAEVETFAAFVVARRNLQQQKIMTNEIPTQELMQLVMAAGSFDWLSADEEDVYSPDDGEAVQWPA